MKGLNMHVTMRQLPLALFIFFMINSFCIAKNEEPSLFPTSTPSTTPTIEDYCVDLPGWTDSQGDGCLVYAANKNCDTFGECCENYHHVANTACCICGGGFISKGRIPSMVPSLTPSYTKTPSVTPSDVPSESPITPTAGPSYSPTATQLPTIGPPVSISCSYLVSKRKVFILISSILLGCVLY